MRSGRLGVRAAAVAALLLAATTAVVVLTRSSGDAASRPSHHATAVSGAIAQTVIAGSSPTAKERARLAPAKLAASQQTAQQAVTTPVRTAKPPLEPARVAQTPVIPAPKTTPVAVLNGGTSQGAAAALADRLRSLGYPVPVVGNAGRRDLPMAIEYSAGLGPAARALARHVGSVQYVTPFEGPNRNLSGARLLVIVGG
jgi:hypothetical protein